MQPISECLFCTLLLYFVESLGFSVYTIPSPANDAFHFFLPSLDAFHFFVPDCSAQDSRAVLNKRVRLEKARLAPEF